MAFQLGLLNPLLFNGIIGFAPAIGMAQTSQGMWDNIARIRMATILGDQDFNFAAVDQLMKEIPARVHRADGQPVCVGVGLDSLHPGHDQPGKARGQVDQLLHRGPTEGQKLGHLLGREGELGSKGLEPTIGYVHDRANWLRNRMSFS